MRCKVVAGVNVLAVLTVHPIQCGGQPLLPNWMVFAVVIAQQNRIGAGTQWTGFKTGPEWRFIHRVVRYFGLGCLRFALLQRNGGGCLEMIALNPFASDI